MNSVVHTRFTDVGAVILAGGRSSRMGSNKALLPGRGGRFIESIQRLLSSLFDDVLLVTNTPEQYEFLPCRSVPDLYPGRGVLAGIHSGLRHSSASAVFTVACDMPYLSEGLIRHLAALADPGGVVIPHGPGGAEPLHAVYGKGCLPAMEAALEAGERRIVSFFDQVPVRCVMPREVACLDPVYDSFRNINTPEEYFRLRREQQAAGREGAEAPSDRVITRSALAGVRAVHQAAAGQAAVGLPGSQG